MLYWRLDRRTSWVGLSRRDLRLHRVPNVLSQFKLILACPGHRSGIARRVLPWPIEKAANLAAAVIQCVRVNHGRAHIFQRHGLLRPQGLRRSLRPAIRDCPSCRRLDIKLQRVAVEGKLRRWRPGRDTAALSQTALVRAGDATASTNEPPECWRCVTPPRDEVPVPSPFQTFVAVSLRPSLRGSPAMSNGVPSSTLPRMAARPCDTTPLALRTR